MEQSNQNLKHYEENRPIFLAKRPKEDVEDLTIDQLKKRPKKAKYRMRAHINPLNDTAHPFPLNSNYVDWSKHFPTFFGKEDSNELYLNTKDYPTDYDNIASDEVNGKSGRTVDFVDVGCGFGGLTVSLGEAFPDKLTLGMEIRDKLVDFVGLRIRSLRNEHEQKKYNNVSVLRTNVMRHVTTYFRKGSLEKMFFCFADPHFKKSKHRRRIINTGFLTEYAFLMKKGGRLYAITDVKDLHDWQYQHLKEHRMFKELSKEEIKDDPCIDLIYNTTEEGKKVARNDGSKWYCVFERI